MRKVANQTSRKATNWTLKLVTTSLNTYIVWTKDFLEPRSVMLGKEMVEMILRICYCRKFAWSAISSDQRDYSNGGLVRIINKWQKRFCKGKCCESGWVYIFSLVLSRSIFLALCVCLGKCRESGWLYMYCLALLTSKINFVTYLTHITREKGK